MLLHDFLHPEARICVFSLPEADIVIYFYEDIYFFIIFFV